MDLGPVVLLKCHFNNYAWGKRGRNSEVARLYSAGHSNFAIDDSKTYSELWMGTHPNGPAFLKNEDVKLSVFIKSESENNLYNPRERNNNLMKDDRNEHHLPFIMKVMSIEQTLSLQVHPTKQQAAFLHERDPINYPDRNHKPELAYALTRFELLCGFRPAPELLHNLKVFRCFRDLFGRFCQPLMSLLEKEHAQDDILAKQALKECFSYMMDLPDSKVVALIEELLDDLDTGLRGCLQEETVYVIRKINKECQSGERRKRDIGIFSPLFLNHMILQPGECCYYAAEELHAYISGECVECVGCSNNTLRAAMTPKFIDKPHLKEVLNYQMTNPDYYLVPASTLENYPSVDEYSPDCRDFQLHRIRVKKGDSNAELPVLDCGSIMVIHSGSAVIEEVPSVSNLITEDDVICKDPNSRRTVKRGDIFYIRPGKRLRFAKCSADMEAFRTFSYEEGPDHENRIVLPEYEMFQKSFSLDALTLKQTNKAKMVSDCHEARREVIFTVDSEMDGCV